MKVIGHRRLKVPLAKNHEKRSDTDFFHLLEKQCLLVMHCDIVVSLLSEMLKSSSFALRSR